MELLVRVRLPIATPYLEYIMQNNEIKFSWLDLTKAIYYFLDKKRPQYLAYTLILISVFFYGLVPTYIIGMVVDFFTNFTAGDSLMPFYYYTTFLALSWGIVALVRLTVKKRLSNIQSDVTYFTRVKGFERLLDFSIKWHDSENTGNKVQRIQNGTDSLKQIQHLLSQEVFANLVSIVGVLGMFLFIRPLFFFYSLLYIVIFLAVQLSYYHRMVEMNNQNNILMEKAGGVYYEGLNNLLTIKTLGVKDDFKKNINSREGENRDYNIRKVAMMNNKWKWFQVVNALSIGGFLYFTGQSFVAGLLSLGSIFVVYNYFQKLNDAISKSTDVIDKLINSKVGVARMMSIFKDNQEVQQGKKDFPLDWSSIDIKNAVFNYPTRLENSSKLEDGGLQDISLSIKKYEKVGIVGKSGSGKSTLAKILLGLYEWNSGTFMIGENHFKDIAHDSITKNIALVLQDSEMFNLSLKDNITLMRQFDEGLFSKAIAVAQLDDLLQKLPNGIDTLIGEKGYRLSGGERQRIGIARAIYKDPQILILDEATSSLDTKTESLIQQALEEHLTKKTVISIAHRVSTLKNVDRIIVFGGGRIVEEGKFDELSNNPNSNFFDIHSQQEEK